MLQKQSVHMVLALAGLVAILALLSSKSYAQNACEYTITGKVVDNHSGEPLADAYVKLEDSNRGAVTSSEGFFNLSNLCQGEIHLVVSHVGCQPKRMVFQLGGDSTISISMEHHHELLAEVEIDAEQLARPTFAPSNRLEGRKLAEGYGSDLGDNLESIGGVSLQRLGSSIRKPVIHGFEGARISYISNDLAYQGQTWAIDHAPALSLFGTGAIEIIRGPEALAYGGGALGGSIKLLPMEKPIDPHVHGKIFGQGESNGQAFASGILVEGGSKHIHHWKWRATAYGKRSGDQSAPGYLLSNSGFRRNFLQLENYYSSKLGETYVKASVFRAKNAILFASHAGNLTDLEKAIEADQPRIIEDFTYEIDYPFQQADHYSLEVKHEKNVTESQKLTITYAFQQNQRLEFDRRRAGRSSIPVTDITKFTHSFRAEHQLNAARESWKLTTGINYLYVNNWFNPNTGTLPLLPKYLSYQPSFYSFLTNTWGKWNWQLGGRIALHEYDIQLPTRQTVEQHDRTFVPISASLGVDRRIANKPIKSTTQLSISSRAPEVAEMFIDGIHHGLAAIERGERNLNPEQAYSLIQSFIYYPSEKFALEVSGYGYYFPNYIYSAPGESELTIRGAFPVFTYEETEMLQAGVDINARGNFSERWSWRVSGQYVYRRDLQDDDFLVFTPPPSTNFRLGYRTERIAQELKAWGIWGQLEAVAEQTQFPEGVDFDDPPQGYGLVHVGIETEFFTTAPLTAELAVENVFNASYRSYLDRFRYYADLPGRNVRLNLIQHF